ncbi:zona pellucida sperm-binding protein 3-like [Rhineura floridana]|uniref:zona pellucida sperm-binding protein 3-like n=1 Tax=Rhineura floridana TaxID=261503 RepID=UPI002AC84A01|nr:zona pellucida sperm-binding protein 3-like [Rhineura floridana]
MASCRRVIAGLWWAAVFVELLAAQAVAQGQGLPSPTAAGSNPREVTTATMGFFRKVFHAAKGLVWSGNSNATMSTATSLPTLPSPVATSAQAQVQFVQGAQPNEVKLNFSLRVLNEDLSVAAEPGIYVEGSVIYLEARVQASPGLFPKLFIDECYGTDAQPQSHFRRVYIIVDNHGCMSSGELEARWFRKDDSVLVFTMPAFLLTGKSEEIYIHCLLTAWSQKIPPTPGKKACYFDSISSSWKNVDEPSKTSVCKCCDSYCPVESPPFGNEKAFWGEGRLHREVVGPLAVHREDVPWFEGQCHTMKRFLLVSVAFGGSCLLAALFAGALVALGLAVYRYSHTSKPLKNRMEQPYQTELQTVLGSLAVDEDVEKESSLDYCKLKSDTPEKA